MLREDRRAQIAEKVNKCDNNVKKLYIVVKSSHEQEPRIPLSALRKQRDACKWVFWYLYGENQEIRDSLEVHPTYNPQVTAKAFMCKLNRLPKKKVTQCIRDG